MTAFQLSTVQSFPSFIHHHQFSKVLLCRICLSSRALAETAPSPEQGSQHCYPRLHSFSFLKCRPELLLCCSSSPFLPPSSQTPGLFLPSALTCNCQSRLEGRKKNNFPVPLAQNELQGVPFNAMFDPLVPTPSWLGERKKTSLLVNTVPALVASARGLALTLLSWKIQLMK